MKFCNNVCINNEAKYVVKKTNQLSFHFYGYIYYFDKTSHVFLNVFQKISSAIKFLLGFIISL